MKIDSSVKSVGTPSGGSRSTAAQPSKGAVAPAANVGVELSPMATRLQELSGSMASAPVVDAARVSEIKQAIAEGRFTVNPGKIADGLIAGIRQMIAAQR